jgi:hypothetical protein
VAQGEGAVMKCGSDGQAEDLSSESGLTDDYTEVAWPMTKANSTAETRTRIAVIARSPISHVIGKQNLTTETRRKASEHGASEIRGIGNGRPELQVEPPVAELIDKRVDSCCPCGVGSGERPGLANGPFAWRDAPPERQKLLLPRER